MSQLQSTLHSWGRCVWVVVGVGCGAPQFPQPALQTEPATDSRSIVAFAADPPRVAMLDRTPDGQHRLTIETLRYGHVGATPEPEPFALAADGVVATEGGFEVTEATLAHLEKMGFRAAIGVPDGGELSFRDGAVWMHGRPMPPARIATTGRGCGSPTWFSAPGVAVMGLELVCPGTVRVTQSHAFALRHAAAAYYSEHGIAAYRSGDIPTATKRFESALAEVPGAPLLLYNLASCQALAGEVQRAQQTLAQAHAAGGDLIRQWARTDRDFEILRQTAIWPDLQPSSPAAAAPPKAD